MARSSRTARSAGTNFESCTAAYLSRALADTRIERRAKTGAKDRGDVAGVRMHGGGRVVVECKDYAGRIGDFRRWLREAEAERGNDGAEVGVVVAKLLGVPADRRTLGAMGGQLVMMTLRDLCALLAGGRGLVEGFEEE